MEGAREFWGDVVTKLLTFVSFKSIERGNVLFSKSHREQGLVVLSGDVGQWQLDPGTLGHRLHDLKILMMKCQLKARIK